MNYILKLRIADFSSTTSIKNDDLFIVSRYSNVYESKKLSFMVYKSILFTKLASLSSFVPNGTFDFDSGRALLINSPSITELSSVVNIEEGNKLLEYLIYLSSMVYGTLDSYEYFDDNEVKTMITDFPNVDGIDSYYPSYIGQVLILDRHYTETDLCTIYGNHTTWKQKAQGRLVLGAGQVGSNNLYDFGNITTKQTTKFNSQDLGGEISTVLTKIPSHSHRFAGADWEDLEFGDFPESYLVFNLDVTSPPQYTKIDSRDLYMHVVFDKGGNVAGDYLHGPNDDNDDAEKVPTPVLSAVPINDRIETRTFRFTPKGEFDYNKTKNLGHNNMPPYEPLYLWERVS